MNGRIPILVGALLAAPAALADQLPLVQVAVHAGYRAGGSLEDSVTGDDRDLQDGASVAVAFELRYGKSDGGFPHRSASAWRCRCQGAWPCVSKRAGT